MARPGRHADLRHYVEEWGMLFELLGANRMMGRVLGWLLTCDPPEQTAKQMAEGIGASISSVSTALKQLSASAMAERVGVPGSRSVHFRIRPGMWADMFRMRMGYTGALRQLAEEGIAMLPSGQRRLSLRLEEIRSYCEFVEREFPPMLEKWKRHWERERSAS